MSMTNTFHSSTKGNSIGGKGKLMSVVIFLLTMTKTKFFL